MKQAGHIVIVESDDLIRELVKGWLTEAGFSVIAAAGAAPAPKRAPRLVIANVSSPRGAGALIRGMQELYKAPIMLISARFRRGLGASKDAAYRLRVRKVLPKPFTQEELLAAVHEILADN